MSCQISLSVTSMETSTAKSYNLIVTVKCLNVKYKNFIQICTKHIFFKKREGRKRQCVKKFLEQFVKYTNQKNIIWNFDFEAMIMRCKKWLLRGITAYLCDLFPQVDNAEPVAEARKVLQLGTAFL